MGKASRKQGLWSNQFWVIKNIIYGYMGEHFPLTWEVHEVTLYIQLEGYVSIHIISWGGGEAPLISKTPYTANIQLSATMWAKRIFNTSVFGLWRCRTAKVLPLLKLHIGESSFENTMDSQENRQIIRQSHKFSLRGQWLDLNYPTSDTFESLVFEEGLDVGKGEKKEKRMTSSKVGSYNGDGCKTRLRRLKNQVKDR